MKKYCITHNKLTPEGQLAKANVAKVVKYINDKYGTKIEIKMMHSKGIYEGHLIDHRKGTWTDDFDFIFNEDGDDIVGDFFFGGFHRTESDAWKSLLTDIYGKWDPYHCLPIALSGYGVHISIAELEGVLK